MIRDLPAIASFATIGSNSPVATFSEGPLWLDSVEKVGRGLRVMVDLAELLAVYCMQRVLLRPS
jgi:hypothetical protein